MIQKILFQNSNGAFFLNCAEDNQYRVRWQKGDAPAEVYIITDNGTIKTELIEKVNEKGKKFLLTVGHAGDYDYRILIARGVDNKRPSWAATINLKNIVSRDAIAS